MFTEAVGDDDREAGEREALDAMLHGEGWRCFLALVDRHWGAEAALAKIARGLEGCARGDQIAINDTAQNVHFARQEILKVLRLPKDRISELAPEKKSRRPFDVLRRTTR